MSDVEEGKKPSEIAQTATALDTRETGRPTDMKELESQARNVKTTANDFVCCCIDPYIREEGSPPEQQQQFREGDVFKHRTHFKTRVICFNLCQNTENTTQTIITKANDGTVVKTVTVEDLNQPNQYFLVRSEKCKHKHHELTRLSILGRLLVSCCTFNGLTSTCRKFLCIDDCVSTVPIETIRCERSLYSRRHF